MTDQEKLDKLRAAFERTGGKKMVREDADYDIDDLFLAAREVFDLEPTAEQIHEQAIVDVSAYDLGALVVRYAGCCKAISNESEYSNQHHEKAAQILRSIVIACEASQRYVRERNEARAELASLKGELAQFARSVVPVPPVAE